MLQRKMLWAVTLGWGFAALIAGAAEPEAVEQLIKKLGSSRFVERERAQREIEALGTDALPALKKAVLEGDLEIKSRAGDMVRRLEEKLLTDNVLAPKQVQLSLKDASVADAIKELSKQSGYPIQLQGDVKTLEDRKVTLETGKVSFWEAFDRLCVAAGVTEQAAIAPKIKNPIPKPGIQIQPLPRPGIQIRPLPAPAPGVLPVQPPKPVPAPGVLRLPEAPAPGKVPLNGINNQPGAKAPAIFDPKAIGQAPPVEKAVEEKKKEPAPFPNQPVVPAQVQIQNLKLQIQGGVIVMEDGVVIGNPGANNKNITVGPGQAKAVPTSYSGAVRVRLVEPNAGIAKKAGAVTLVLDVAPEPRLQNFAIQGSPKIDKVIDDQDQSLTLVMGEDPANPNPGANVGGPVFQPAIARIALPMQPQFARQIPIHLKPGEKPAQTLKELAGSLTASVLLPSEAVLTIKDFEKGVGQTYQAKNGGAVTINAVEKIANGFKIDLTVEQPPRQANNVFNGVAQIQIGVIGNTTVNSANNRGVPELVDAKGKSYQTSPITYRTDYRNGSMRISSKVTYTRVGGAGEAESMVMNGQRTTTIEVPFAFKDVPLK